jgi:DNA-directed RNA polymerase specialized sigma24 family protein
MALRPQRPPDAQTPACPCRHGDVPAELAGQRPLLERAAAGDREAFALVYDTQVEGVYRYLLAWTGNRTETAELTAQVFHAAIGWLPATTSPEGEAAAWLTAMTRDALAQRQGASRAVEAAGDVVAAVARLREPEREVVVLRLLLGHSLDHTAHLSGYSRRAVLELQLTACLAIHELTGGTHTGSAPPDTRPAPSAEEFERLLGRWEIDLTGSDPALADALAVAVSLRRSVPEYVVPPPAELVERLRAELVAGGEPGRVGELPAGGAVDSRDHHPFGSATFPLRGAQQPGVVDPAAPGSAAESQGGELSKNEFSGAQLSDAQLAAAQLAGVQLSEAEFWAQLSDPELSVVPASGGLAAAGLDSRDQASAGSRTARTTAATGGTGVGGWLARRPWVATGVATAGIVVVLAVQAFGGQGAPRGCGGRPCPVSTTAAVAAGAGSSVGTPLTTVRESTTTSSTVGDDVGVVAPTVPRTSAVTAPPTTRPATTAPPTTARPRPTTTTVPSTTAPPTTAPTTTTAAPVPPT